MIRYTLLGDGSSDKTLLKIIKWTLSQQLPDTPMSEAFANFSFSRRPPTGLKEKIIKAIEYWPCDILFVHRDAEQTKNIDAVLNARKTEIRNAVPSTNCNHVAIIPIKMMETWLLTDEVAILKAAGNTNNEVRLPKLQKLESITNPKEQLHEYLRNASGLKGRRLDSFNVNQAVHLVAEHTEDFSNLRHLSGFISFEKDLIITLSALGYLS